MYKSEDMASKKDKKKGETKSAEELEKDKKVQQEKEPVDKKAEEKEEKAESESHVEEEKEEIDETEALKLQLEETKDKYIRLSAEFDNYRRRTLREKAELLKSAGEQILVSVLPVIDDFERGISTMDDAKDIHAVKQGVELIYNKFLDFLKQNGVQEIQSIEQDFDTDLHEAITKIPAPKEESKGKIVDVIQKGYKLNDKVIRFAKVVVGE